jgi:uncharacterized cupin superfamily protein
VKRANTHTDPYEYDDADPDGYRAAVAHVGRSAGGQALAVKAYEIPPGQSLCPYHYEYEEEWLVLLDGALVLRGPDGEEELTSGDVVCFPPGPEGAHKVTNRSQATARLLMFSSAREPAFAVYPDSDKISAWSGNPDDELMIRRADGKVHYYDGEL